jgi:hypothetical protein
MEHEANLGQHWANALKALRKRLSIALQLIRNRSAINPQLIRLAIAAQSLCF